MSNLPHYNADASGLQPYNSFSYENVLVANVPQLVTVPTDADGRLANYVTFKGTAATTNAKLSKEHQKNLAKVAKEKGKVTPADIKAEVGETVKPKPVPAVKSALDLADALVPTVTREVLEILLRVRTGREAVVGRVKCE